MLGTFLQNHPNLPLITLQTVLLVLWFRYFDSFFPLADLHDAFMTCFLGVTVSASVNVVAFLSVALAAPNRAQLWAGRWLMVFLASLPVALGAWYMVSKLTSPA